MTEPSEQASHTDPEPSDGSPTAELDTHDEVVAPAHDEDVSDPYDDPDWDGVQDPGANPHAVEQVEESDDA